MAAQSKTCVNKQYVSNWYEVLHKLGKNVTVVNMRKKEKQANLKYKLIETHLGNASKQYVFLVSGKATRMPEVRGEWRMTAALSYREARSTEGTVPMLWPYMITFSGLIPYLEHHIQTDEFIHTYTL